jgi:Cys-tRNA synthase (O-phospho-L-seryl-tRNA:Cys-tRNA synthase)
MKRILDVLRIERGAVTADVLAVMCGLAGLGLFLISAIDQHLTTFAAADYAVISMSQR